MKDDKTLGSDDGSGRDSKLTEEIIETQKARSDLIKWKFLVVAVLGGDGLGLMGKIWHC